MFSNQAGLICFWVTLQVELRGLVVHRLGSEVAQGPCSGSLILQGQKLYSTVDQGCWLDSLTRWVTECALNFPGVFSHTSHKGKTWRLCSAMM